MKTLIVYYSRTGNTEKVAKMIKEELNGDIDIINPIKSYKGPIGFAKGGMEASTKKTPQIKTEKDPSNYDLTIIGTPVWASTMASPVLSYLKENKDKFNKTSFFITTGGSGIENTINNMEKESEVPIATLGLTKEDMKNYQEKTQKFIDEIKSKI